MKIYFVALIALFLALVSYSTFAQSPLIPIPTSKPTFSGTQTTPNVGSLRKPNLVSATVKGSLYIKKGDEKTQFRITVYKLINNRWVNVNNFSTLIKPNGEYLTVIRGEGTYRFVPSVRFNPKFKYTFTPANHTVRIREGANNEIFIRNFGYKKDNRK